MAKLCAHYLTAGRGIDSLTIKKVARQHLQIMSDRTRTTLEEAKGLGSFNDLPVQTSCDLQLNGARTVLPITSVSLLGQTKEILGETVSAKIFFARVGRKLSIPATVGVTRNLVLYLD